MTLDWVDGQPYSSRFGDVYFSSDSGLEETRHVFLRGNFLAERFAALKEGESFCIGETGFGTGLNFLCAWQLFEQVAPSNTYLDFFSVEKFPLSDDELRAALLLWPELRNNAELLPLRWQRRVPGWNRWSFFGGRIRVTLVLGDVAQALPELPASCIDAWFLDGFSPAKNPEMWSEAVLGRIAYASHAGTTLATYTSAGWVRRILQQVGFQVEKTPGFGRKREMIRAVLEIGELVTPKEFPRTALIIGAGIAGCAAAHSLALRGISVTLIDRAPQLASAASGNPRGILHARFGGGNNPLHQFVLAAYGYTLGLLDQVLPVDGAVRSECGLLQLACKEAEIKRIERLRGREWPAHLLQFVDASQATQLAGVKMEYGGLWFPTGGWVVPPVLCANLVDDKRFRHPKRVIGYMFHRPTYEPQAGLGVCRMGETHQGAFKMRWVSPILRRAHPIGEVHSSFIRQRLGCAAATLEKTESGWRASGRDTQGNFWDEGADVVLVCCAHSAKQFSQFAHFPLIAVRGQISEVPQTQASRALNCVVCGDGYCAPAVEDVHVIGATHAFNDESNEVRASDHSENLVSLGAYAPDLLKILDEPDADKLSGRASLRCSAPGSMPLVGEVQQGLYCSLAHGTRGLLTAGIAAEVLAAQICKQLPPLPATILNELSPKHRL